MALCLQIKTGRRLYRLRTTLTDENILRDKYGLITALIFSKGQGDMQGGMVNKQHTAAK
jgi:hypothetical protein